MPTAVFHRADATRLPLKNKSVDLVLGSPPYCDARTYGIDAQRGCREWVDWMLDVTTEAARVSRGLVLWVCAGVTRDHLYWPAPEMLLAEWWKWGGQCWRPVFWHRVGIPGSGGKQWFRADVEYVLAMKGAPGPIPWADNVAMGEPPKYGPGGAMSHRLTNGGRRTHNPGRRSEGKTENQTYIPPEKANPGNLVHTVVGGGHIGDWEAHENEAPYPEKLVEWFIRSCCPPGGRVCDPFSGSGTTVVEAVRLGRHGIGFDLRDSQVQLGRARLFRRRGLGGSGMPERKPKRKSRKGEWRKVKGVWQPPQREAA
jgi:adenine-specific DNA-methyltransferase